jgi:hypothetical protein
VLAFARLAAAFGYPLVNGITHLAHGLPSYVSQAERGKGWVGHLVTKYHVQARVLRNAPKLAAHGKDLGNIAQQRGLADTRLTAHHQHLAPARPDIGEQPIHYPLCGLRPRRVTSASVSAAASPS